MTKLLNLDDIALDSQRTVQYNGQSYKVRDFNVDEFIRFQKHFNAFRKCYNGSSEEEMTQVIVEVEALTAIGVPDFPITEVRKLNPVQMLALVSMIANMIPTSDDETAEVIEEKKGQPESLEV